MELSEMLHWDSTGEGVGFAYPPLPSVVSGIVTKNLGGSTRGNRSFSCWWPMLSCQNSTLPDKSPGKGGCPTSSRFSEAQVYLKLWTIFSWQQFAKCQVPLGTDFQLCNPPVELWEMLVDRDYVDVLVFQLQWAPGLCQHLQMLP